MPRSRSRIRLEKTIGFVVIAMALGFALTSRPIANRESPPQPAATSFTKPSAETIQAALANLPFSFEETANAGEYVTRNGACSILLSPEASHIELIGGGRAKEFSVRLIDSNPNAAASGLGPLPGKSNYIIGNDPAKWRTNVSQFARVRYQDVYPGINLVYYGNQRQLEYDFVVAPGASPQAIRLGFDRTTAVAIDADGALVLKKGEVEIRQPRPVVYQEVAGLRSSVEARFVLNDHQAGFEIGEYDQSLPLVIDPTLVFSSYLGGTGDDIGSSIAIDQSHNIYIAGTTASANFPTQGPAFSSNAGLGDIFVTKINAAGNAILYSTYVGGSGQDRGDGLTVDSNGNAYVVGRVDSTSVNFPTTAGVVAGTYRGGDFDAVVFKLSAQGNALVYSTFLGAEDNDSAEGIAVDGNGNAYVTGGARSHGFPTTANAYANSNSGDVDAYLTKFNATATTLLYSSFLGGNSTDRGSVVAVDSAGNAYLAGYTSSADFPTENAAQNSHGGSFDAFVARIDTTQTGINSLVYCSYLGGLNDDKAYGLALDATNNIYVTGQTNSSSFPVLNPMQPAIGGSFDAFLAKYSSAGAKVYATYIGGSADDRGTGVAVNAAGETYVTGFTSSANFPTVTPLQLANAGGFDAFLSKLNASGNTLIYSTYFGGSGNESNGSTVTSTTPLVIDGSGNAYITGYTTSTNFPTLTPLQAANAGVQDVFVAKISDVTPSADYALSISPGSRTVSPGGSTTYTMTGTPTGGFTGTISLSVTGLSNDSSGSFSPASIVISNSSPQSSTLTVNTTALTPPGTYTVSVNSTSGNLQHSTSAQLIVSGPSSVNMQIGKTASPNPGTVGASLTYRVAVTNGGPSPATNVIMTDTLPSGINFVSATSTQGNCSGTTTVTCNIGSMANSATVIINIIVTPQAAATLSNTASVTATESDPDATNNSVTIQTTVTAPSSGPSMLDPNLSVKTVVTGLSQPTSMAFIGDNDFFVLEKNTGKVQRIKNGALLSTVLDLPVNSASERGLLGIALHPNFAVNGYAYLFWTESSTGNDSTSTADVFQPLSNRIDRYVWNGANLTFDLNLIKLRAYQADPNQSLRGNHNGGVLRFGPDGKLYILMGDNGRRGFLQNLPCGPTNVCPGPIVQDDQFGGPEPDDAHLTGVILRLNDDGSTPADNPFFNAATSLTGQAAANIRKIYAYGVRNGFGMGFDPLSGNLWDQENGDDAFDEMNRITPGSNNGWVQMMGPSSRVAQFKQIESTYGTGDLQQLRWSPTFTADTEAAALARLYVLPGSHYNDPEFSWKYAIPAAPLGFVQGRGLGLNYEGDMFVGAARTFLYGGFLFRFNLSQDRLHFDFNDDPRLIDRVADNVDKFDIGESEGLLIGKDFGITTDIQTGPNGNLFVVSNTNSAVYEISGKQPTLYTATLTSGQEVPPNNSTGTGAATLLLSPDELTARVSLNFTGLTSPESTAHIHGPGAAGVIAPVLFPLPNGNLSDFPIAMSPTDVQNLKNGLLYINVHSNNFPNGEIRGQFVSPASDSSVQFTAANYFASEAGGRATVTVTRLGSLSSTAVVNYATSDTAGLNDCNVKNGVASQRCDFVNMSGQLVFSGGESQKTLLVPLVDDGYAEGNESFAIQLSNPSGTFLGSPNIATVTITDNETVDATVNPLEDVKFWVRQHYIDFLGREPDPPGFQGWQNILNNCPPGSIACDKIEVSSAFFRSNEFQVRGYFIYRFYPTIAKIPIYSEFTPDFAKVSGFLNDQQLEDNKAAFVIEFMNRPEFRSRYDSLTTPTAYVDGLLTTVGLPNHPSRQTWIDALTNSTMTRPQVLRSLVESSEMYTKYYNEAFVILQYFGYLRRTADASYLQWIQTMNSNGGDYRVMVNGFLNSVEYRKRFGP